MGSKKLKVGDKVKYTSPETVGNEHDKVYRVCSYNEKLDLYGIESELDEVYLLSGDVLQKIEQK
ncbi:MAG: hypothetical protein IIZ74_02885 [Erysipelotrichaceae bacterium]|nr:hypothetical protein [Erysipelotrichaceae bacterium]